MQHFWACVFLLCHQVVCWTFCVFKASEVFRPSWSLLSFTTLSSTHSWPGRRPRSAAPSYWVSRQHTVAAVGIKAYEGPITVVGGDACLLFNWEKTLFHFCLLGLMKIALFTTRFSEQSFIVAKHSNKWKRSKVSISTVTELQAVLQLIKRAKENIINSRNQRLKLWIKRQQQMQCHLWDRYLQGRLWEVTQKVNRRDKM